MTQIPRATYTTGPTSVVRIAGVPITVLDRLRAERTMNLIEEALESEQELVRMSDPLVEALHGSIGGNEDTPSRRRLIALRRDVYARRMPRRGELEPTVLSGMPPALAAQVERWYAEMQRREDLTRRAEVEFGIEYQKARSQLREVASNALFREGLVLASPSLHTELAKWIQSAEDPKSDRKLERRVVKYLARAATKTSPYSTFTSSTEARWTPDGPAVRFAATSPLSWRRSAVELNAFTLRQICRSLTRWPEVQPHLLVELNTSLVERDGVLRFLGWRGNEAVIELAETPTLRRFLEEVRHGEDRSYDGLVRSLARPAGDDRLQAVARFLDKLIDLGLFETSLQIADSALDPLMRLVQELGCIEGRRVATVRKLLYGLRSELAGYAIRRGSCERFRAAQKIRADLTHLYREFEWDPTGEAFPKNAFYEDTLVPGAVAECSSDAWRKVLDELSLVPRLAGLYDRCLPGRIAAAAFVEDHYGTGATLPFLDFYGDFCNEIRKPKGWRGTARYRLSGADLLVCYEDPFPVPQVGPTQLTELAELQRCVQAHVAGLPVNAAGERRIQPGDLNQIVGAFPHFIAPIESASIHCQVITRDGRLLAVLNELAMGFGRTRARLLRLDALTGGGVFTSARVGASRPGRARCHAEIAGSMGSNLNLRPPTAPLEIDYPGSISDRPPHERIALSDLHVQHDARTRTLRLFSERHGVEITPVHVGGAVEFLLPPACRFLIQMFGQAVPRFEFIKSLATASTHRELDGVCCYPRLYLGDVVLNRALWTVPAERVPRRGHGESDLHFLLSLTRWRHQHGIPERCFARIFALGSSASRPSKVSGLLEKARKPLFIDFASPHSLLVLEHVVAAPDRLVFFEEMLPTPDDSMVRDETGSYASEFIVELTIGGEDDGQL